jgi:hypothetical protein
VRSFVRIACHPKEPCPGALPIAQNQKHDFYPGGASAYITLGYSALSKDLLLKESVVVGPPEAAQAHMAFLLLTRMAKSEQREPVI